MPRSVSPLTSPPAAARPRPTPGNLTYVPFWQTALAALAALASVGFALLLSQKL